MTHPAPRFALPGTWARIPLHSEAATLSSIRKMTEQLTNRIDEFATLRAELRARFVRAADVAKSGGATDLFIGLELGPGMPLPDRINQAMPRRFRCRRGRDRAHLRVHRGRLLDRRG